MRLALASLNLRLNLDRWAERRGLIVAELLALQPDLISLQEVHRPSRQALWLQGQINGRLEAAQGGRPYQLAQARKRHLINGYHEGVAILSRLPILSHDAYGLGYGGRVALRANVALTPRDTFDFVAVHLHHPRAEQEARLEQVMALAGWLNRHNAADLQAVAGDFNETPAGPAIAYMKQMYRSAFELAWGHEPLATFPTALAERPDDWAGTLDYIFLSPAAARVGSVQIICRRPAAGDPTLYPSDHVGLMAVLDLGLD
ncbi:MAG: endonuclease/exonuclease/phosphatase family protein [Candidatus Promineifilaceae bacterium]